MVTPVQKTAFAAEMKTLRAAASEGKLKLDKTQSSLKLATDVEIGVVITMRDRESIIQNRLGEFQVKIID